MNVFLPSHSHSMSYNAYEKTRGTATIPARSVNSGSRIAFVQPNGSAVQNPPKAAVNAVKSFEQYGERVPLQVLQIERKQARSRMEEVLGNNANGLDNHKEQEMRQAFLELLQLLEQHG